MLQTKGTGKGSLLRTFLKALSVFAMRLLVEIFQIVNLEQFGMSLAFKRPSE
jgi:hypothetical protein